MELPGYPVAGEGIAASWGRQVVDYLRSVTLRPGVGYLATRQPAGTTLAFDRVRTTDGARAMRQSWDLSWSAPATVVIATGDLDLGDLGSVAASHAGLALTGATAWIYVERLTGASTATIKFSTTKPQSNSSGLRKRLYLLESSDGGASYRVTRDVRGDADYGSLIQ